MAQRVQTNEKIWREVEGRQQGLALLGLGCLSPVHEHVELQVGLLAELGPTLWAACLPTTTCGPENNYRTLLGTGT